jgi:hypothetical protein
MTGCSENNSRRLTQKTFMFDSRVRGIQTAWPHRIMLPDKREEVGANCCRDKPWRWAQARQQSISTRRPRECHRFF